MHKTAKKAAALTGFALSMLGCKTAIIHENITGSPKPISKVKSTREFSAYSIDSIDRTSQQLALNIIQKRISEIEKEVYEQVPRCQVTYEVKQNPPPKNYFLGPFIYYPAINAITLGAPLLADAYFLLTGQPQNTIFNNSFYFNPFGEGTFQQVEAERKEVSRKILSSEERNKKIIKESELLHIEPASQIEVRLSTEYPIFNKRNELIGRTDSAGNVVFELKGKPGRMTLETLTNGVNEKINIK
jgi:hypothetical protein